MRVIGYTAGAGQADQARRVEGGAAFRDDDLAEILTDDPDRLRELVAAGNVAAVLVARLDRLPTGWLDDDDCDAVCGAPGAGVCVRVNSCCRECTCAL